MRLIDADALRRKLIDRQITTQFFNQREREEIGCIVDLLDKEPTVDPESLRPKGRWVLLDECSNAGVYCSVCHKKVYKEQYANQKLKSPYCPNCGAKMEE